ncbi:MAG: hypothetical protein M3Q70_00385 [bacterium]|nr:hypothetical protein [bacterium]
MDRSSYEFGRGSFVGTIMRDPEAFFGSDVRDQARMLGWVAGCPVVEQLTDPDNPTPGRGPENMMNRYGQINFWFKYAMESVVQKVNPDLYNQMMKDVERLPIEPIGRHEPESIPEEYREKMQPMTTLVGYVTPRLLIDQLGINSGAASDELDKRFSNAHKTLKNAAANVDNPESFLVRFADIIRQGGQVDDEILKKHFDASGWLEEHNAQSMADRLKDTARNEAPELYEIVYS